MNTLFAVAIDEATVLSVGENTMDEMAMYINSQTAADMGIKIPQDILDKATDLAKEDL